jgi:hypothetical protein
MQRETAQQNAYVQEIVLRYTTNVFCCTLINKQLQAYRHHDSAAQQNFPAPETSNHQKSKSWILETTLHNSTTALEPREKLAFCHTRRRGKILGLRWEHRASTPFPEGQKEETRSRRVRGEGTWRHKMSGKQTQGETGRLRPPNRANRTALT